MMERSEGDVGLKTEKTLAGITVLSICSSEHALSVPDAIGSSRLVANTPTLPPAVHGSNYHLLIYRLDGVLSVTFVTDCVSSNEACQKADLIEKLGYRVEVWRDGIGIQRQKRH